MPRTPGTDASWVRGAVMGGDDVGLARLLGRLGAAELAGLVTTGSPPPPDAFERLRSELEAAAVAARASGEHSVLAGEVRRVLDGGGHLGATFAALLSGDRARLPVPAPVSVAPPGPPPAPPPPPVSSTTPPRLTPPDPFAVSIPAPPAGGARGGASPTPSNTPTAAGDAFAWGAVAATAVGALLVFRLPTHLLLVLGPLVSLAVIGLLVTDRVHLKDAGRDVPAWGWTLLPPAYLFRRGRKLGQRPVHAYAVVGVGMATRLGLVVLGFGGADLTALETQLADDHAERWGQPVTVTCPSALTIGAGVEFACVVTSVAGDARLELRFRALDDAGNLELTGSSFSGSASSAEPTYSVAP